MYLVCDVTCVGQKRLFLLYLINLFLKNLFFTHSRRSVNGSSMERKKEEVKRDANESLTTSTKCDDNKLTVDCYE